MKIFEESTDAKQETVLIQLTLKEAQLLVEMGTAACAAQPKKRTWKTLQKELDLIPCFSAR